MAEVAPIGDEQSVGAVAATGVGPARDVGDGVLQTREEAIPRRRAGAHPEREIVLGEAPHLVEVVLGFVPPVEEDHVAAELRDPLRVFVHEVGPDHQLASMLARELSQVLDVIEQQPARPERVRHRLRLAAAEIPRLVAVHAKESRAEVRQEFVVQVTQQFVGARLRTRECPARIRLGQMLVLGKREDVIHVAERLQVGHQLDVACGGVGVEFAQQLRFERGRAGSDLRMTSEAEGVLYVEHQHVELEAHAEIDERVQRFGRRHLAARDVEHDPALRKVGSVLDQTGGQHAGSVDQLDQRLDRVAQGRSTRSDRHHVVALDAQPIGLTGVRVAPQLDAGPDSVAARVRLHRKAQTVVAQQRVAEGARAREVGVVRRRVEHDRDAVAQAEAAGMHLEVARTRQKFR